MLLDQGELGAHQPDRAAAWLAAVPPLFPRLGLQLAAHFARLMPLLLGWALAPWPAVREAALRALLGVLRLTWPRAGAHAALVWRVLRRAFDEERLRRRWARAPWARWLLAATCLYASKHLVLSQLSAKLILLETSRAVCCRAALSAGPPASSATASSAADLAEDAALVLWCAAGADFQMQLMTSKEGQADQLLQAVMQRVEEAAAVQTEQAEGDGHVPAATASQPDAVPRTQPPLAA